MTGKEDNNKYEYQRKPRYAILVNDMLNDFIHGNLKCDRAAQIIPKIKLLLEKARQNNIPIFYCNDEHLPIDKYELKPNKYVRLLEVLKPALITNVEGNTSNTKGSQDAYELRYQNGSNSR
jgi:nicotinamidase-related amidase